MRGKFIWASCTFCSVVYTCVRSVAISLRTQRLCLSTSTVHHARGYAATHRILSQFFYCQQVSLMVIFSLYCISPLYIAARSGCMWFFVRRTTRSAEGQSLCLAFRRHSIMEVSSVTSSIWSRLIWASRTATKVLKSVRLASVQLQHMRRMNLTDRCEVKWL